MAHEEKQLPSNLTTMNATVEDVPFIADLAITIPDFSYVFAFNLFKLYCVANFTTSPFPLFTLT